MGNLRVENFFIDTQVVINCTGNASKHFLPCYFFTCKGGYVLGAASLSFCFRC